MAPRAVRANDQRLLDVGGLRRPGQKHAEARPFDVNSGVGVVHRVHQGSGRQHDAQMLHDEGQRPMTQLGVGQPDGAALGHAEFGLDQGKIQVAQVVGIGDGGQVQGRLADARHPADAVRGLAVGGPLVEGLGQGLAIGQADGSATGEFKPLAEGGRLVVVFGPRPLRQVRSRFRRNVALTNRLENLGPTLRVLDAGVARHGESGLGTGNADETLGGSWSWEIGGSRAAGPTD